MTANKKGLGENRTREAMREAVEEKGGLPLGLVRHALIHVALLLIYFLPGGLIWNREDVSIFGLPLSIFMWWILLPILIFINAALFVREFWAQDRQVTTEVRRVPPRPATEEAEGRR
jgi:hypothetical protein